MCFCEQVKYNVVPFVMPQLHNLFKWLEVDFHPLHMAERISGILDYLGDSKETEISQYVPALQDNAIMRLLEQVRISIETQNPEKCGIVIFSDVRVQILIWFHTFFALHKTPFSDF